MRTFGYVSVFSSFFGLCVSEVEMHQLVLELGYPLVAKVSLAQTQPNQVHKEPFLKVCLPAIY